MSEHSTVIRLLGLASRPAFSRAQTAEEKTVQEALADPTEGVRPQRPAKDEPWRRAEWWEYKHYEPR